VVQIPLDGVLNTRSVTTLTGGKLVTWEFGIDGNGYADGYLTMAAALYKGDTDPHALPKDSLIPATDRHPQVQLHYSDDDGINNQSRYVQGLGGVSFPIPPARYSSLFLFVTSSEGNSTVVVTLNYTDGTQDLIKLNVPDYWIDLTPLDNTWFYLLKDLAKWNKNNDVTEKNHHNIDGAELHPNTSKILVSVDIDKQTKGSYLVFWGATGVTA